MTTPPQLQLVNPMATTGIARAVLHSPRLYPRLRLLLPPPLRPEELVRALRVPRPRRRPRLVWLRKLDRARLQLLELLVLGCCEGVDLGGPKYGPKQRSDTDATSGDNIAILPLYIDYTTTCANLRVG
jgi:hypothetical protein